MKDKTNIKAIALTTICIILVISLGVVKFVMDNTNKNNSDNIEITTIQTRETTTAQAGQEYTYVDESGVKYLVKEDGTYKVNDDGTYTYMENFINIPIFQNITFSLANGYSENFTFNKDGSYSLKTIYNSGDYFEMSGKYTASNGLDDVCEALKITTDLDAVAKKLEIDKNNININNLYYVKIMFGASKHFNSDDKPLNEEIYEQTEDEIEQSYNDMEYESFIIYLQPDGTPTSSDDNINYSICGRAYSITNDFYYIDYSDEEHNEFKVNSKYIIKKGVE